MLPPVKLSCISSSLLALYHWMVGSVTGRNVMRLMPSIYQGPNHGSEFYTLGHLWIATLYVLDGEHANARYSPLCPS